MRERAWRRSRPARSFLLALVVLLAGLAGCLGDGGDGQGTTGGPAGDAPSLVPVGEPALVSPAGHRISEFHVVQDPTDPAHLLAAAMDYDVPWGGVGCAVFESHDAGATWELREPGDGLDQPHLYFDPWLAFDPQGQAHLICIEYHSGAGETQLLATRSTDGGTTWAPAVVVPTRHEGMSLDKDSLVASSQGTLIAAFRDYPSTAHPDAPEVPSDLVLARSTDGGRTWQTPVVLAEDTTTPNGFLEGPDGTLYLLHQSSGRQVWVAASEDDGLTWRRSLVGHAPIAPGYNDQNRFVDQRPWAALPSLAVDRVTGAVYVAAQAWDEDAERFTLQLNRSTDGARTFQALPAPEVRSSSCPGCHTTHPTLAVDPEGRVGLVVQLVSDGALDKEVWFTASSDGGATWLDPVRLSATDASNSWVSPEAWRPSPEASTATAAHMADHPDDAPAVAFGAALTPAVAELQFRWNGEYWGMVATPDGFVALWVDHERDGVPSLRAQLVEIMPAR